MRLIWLVVLGLLMNSRGMMAQNPQGVFHLSFSQNGKIIEPSNGEVTLTPSPFDMVFVLSKPMGLLINASNDGKTYRMATKGIKKTLLPGFESTGMAEFMYNPEKMIFVQRFSIGMVYEDKKSHRFDTVVKNGKQLTCVRTIENLHDIDQDVIVPVTNASKSLYLVVIFAPQNGKTGHEVEVSRQCVKVNWAK